MLEVVLLNFLAKPYIGSVALPRGLGLGLSGGAPSSNSTDKQEEKGESKAVSHRVDATAAAAAAAAAAAGHQEIIRVWPQYSCLDTNWAVSLEARLTSNIVVIVVANY